MAELTGPVAMPVDAAYTAAGFEKIEVDINSLSDFADALRREVEVNLKPAWERIGPTLDQPHFGNSAELGLGDKRAAYDAYLRQAKELLHSVIEGTFQLAQSAEKIAASYRRADQFAQLRVEDVNGVLPQIQTPAPSRSKQIPI